MFVPAALVFCFFPTAFVGFFGILTFTGLMVKPSNSSIADQSTFRFLATRFFALSGEGADPSCAGDSSADLRLRAITESSRLESSEGWVESCGQVVVIIGSEGGDSSSF